MYVGIDIRIMNFALRITIILQKHIAVRHDIDSGVFSLKLCLRLHRIMDRIKLQDIHSRTVTDGIHRAVILRINVWIRALENQAFGYIRIPFSSVLRDSILIILRHHLCQRFIKFLFWKGFQGLIRIDLCLHAEGKCAAQRHHQKKHERGQSPRTKRTYSHMITVHFSTQIHQYTGARFPARSTRTEPLLCFGIKTPAGMQ